MQQLHLVGFTTDHKGLILGTRRGSDEGNYVVTLDRAMVEQIEELLRLQAEGTSGDPAANGVAPLRRAKFESKLTPRQVQALLRTGRSVGEVAEEAGMSEEWVGRFAPPVLAEQARVLERAISLTYIKPRIGPSMQPLGESVLWNLAEKGIVLTGQAVEDAWTAFQQSDGGWVVRMSYLADRRRQHADWTVDMTQGVVKAVNKLGNELGYIEPGRRRPAALPPAAPVSPSAQRAAAAPPRPIPPPPLPPRPSGRLSLLASGGSRPASPSAAPSASERPPSKSREPAKDGPAAKGPTKDGPANGETSAPPTPPAPPAPAQPPRERRPRPLRPLSSDSAPVSAVTASAPSSSTSPSSAATGPAAPANASPEAADQPEAGPGGAETPAQPRRERPLRAPSRMRRDEPADAPAPAPVTRRPVLAPRSSHPSAQDPLSPTPPPSQSRGNRFGPPHSLAERKASTVERFGVGTAVAHNQPRPEPDAAPEVTPNNHAGPPGAPPAPRRSLRARPPVIKAEPDEHDMAFAAPQTEGGENIDPITAPVPALDMLDGEADDDAFETFAAGHPGPQDQVLIRAGQAGVSDDPAGPPSGKPAPPEERRGRRKLRRRTPDQS